MDQTSNGSYKQNESPFQAFYHSCLGKIVILIGILILLFIVGIMTKPTQQEMEMEMVEARHMCMQMRGVEKQNSITTTSDFCGAFNQAKTRQEFMNLIHNNKI